MTSSQPTTSSSLLPNPTTPSYANDVEWITAYLTIHVLSDASRIYSYILWIALLVVALAFALMHYAGLRSGVVGSYWSKWSLRRRTWRKKHSLAVAKARGEPHRQPLSLPSNAQLLSLTLLVIAALLLSFVGPDYIAPGYTLWNLGSAPAASALKRADVSAFTPFQPHYTIWKAWWTAGNRTGLIAFALFPLCVLFALKSPPFAILVYTVQLHFDKLSWLHRWSGRLIWFLTALHVVFWSVQLTKDERVGTGKIAYTYAWDYENFIFAWIAFAAMTLLLIFSIKPVRQYHYEAFYFLHILFIPMTLILSAMHHPPLLWWCIAALALWVGERSWRFIKWLRTNGFFGGLQKSVPPRGTHVRMPPPKALVDKRYDISSGRSSDMKYADSSPDLPQSMPFAYPPAGHSDSRPSSSKYIPPPGYAHAELLPGRTVRLRIVTPGSMSWAPGQHFLIAIPSICRFTTHPFTVASICDTQSPAYTRELVFLIRAKSGWTKDLWDTVTCMIIRGQTHPPSEKLPAHCEFPSRGTLMRAYVDGPFGSAARARWGSHSSVLIVTGGSGVSFGLSVLQYVCACLAGSDGRRLGGQPGGRGQLGFQTTRVRFVWLAREFCHIQWCASLLRRCLALVPSPGLQVDIFITNVKPLLRMPPPSDAPTNRQISTAPPGLSLPDPPFLRDGEQSKKNKRGKQHSRSPSADSDSDIEGDTDLDLSYYTGDYIEGEGELGHEEHILDLTNFEGDDDTGLPGEAQLSMSLRREGRARRASARRASLALAAKRVLQSRVEEGLHPPWKNQSSAELLDKSSGLSPLAEEGPDPRDSMHSSVAELPYADNRHSHSSASGSASTSLTAVTNLELPSLSVQLAQSTRERPALKVDPGVSRLSSESARPISAVSQTSAWSDTRSIAALISQTDLEEAAGKSLRVELDDQEMDDVSAVAEFARPGKPKLDRILADEVNRSKGAVIVGCCGPTSLNAVMRKAIAAQIDPGLIRKGDMRGYISLISEDFEY